DDDEEVAPLGGRRGRLLAERAPEAGEARRQRRRHLQFASVRDENPVRRLGKYAARRAPDVAGLSETKRLGPVVDDVVGARPIVSSFFLGKTDGGRRRDEQADDRRAHLAGSLLHEFVRREGSHVSARVTTA